MKMIAIVFMAAMMLLLTGCPGDNGGDGGNWQTFAGGTEGVTLNFEPLNPPTEINAGEEFMVLVVLKNVGEHTVASGDYSVRLRGFSPAEFSTTPDALMATPAEDLQANVLDPDSGVVLESYDVPVQLPVGDQGLIYSGGIAGNTPFPIVADICYQYKTTSNAKLCVKKDLAKTTDTDVCTISGPQAISSSGAPIAIADFQEAGAGRDAVRFSFKVSANAPAAQIAALGSSCSELYQDKDKVFVTVDTGIDGLRCTGFLGTNQGNEGYVKLSDGTRQISCTQTISSAEKSDYVKTVIITAEYDYMDSVSAQVLVKPVVQ
jgi:hypothetical protein